MSTISLDCRSQGMMESIIADRQERYSHVEFISWNNNMLVLAYIPWCLKIRSQYDNCRVWLRNNYQYLRIMKARQIIYSSTIIVLGFIQASPIFICLASTIILLNVLGILYGILLVYIWSSTKKGKWYFRELWRSTLRLENFILPGV